MSKLNKTENIFVLGLILLIITAVSGGLLGLVYEVTKEPIKAVEIKSNNDALRLVLPDGEEFELVDFNKETYQDILEVYKTSNEVGYAFKVETKGYGGQIILIVGINKDGQVSSFQMLKHGETPGLGENANKEFFKERFLGKGPNELVVSKTSNDGDQIQAITGATITSKAIVRGVNSALDYYNNEIMVKEGQ